MASVRKQDSGGYRVRWRDPDGRSREKAFARKVDADRHAATVIADIARGTYRDVAAGRETVQDYAERWRAGQPHRPSSARLIERQLRLHVYPVLGDKPIAQVRRSDVQAWATGLGRGVPSGSPIAPRTVRGVVKTLSAVFNAAVHDDVLASSPCRRLALPDVERREVVPLRVEQILTLADVISPRYRALVLLAGGTGLRLGECLGLRAEDVDFLRRELHVRHQLVDVPGTPVHLGPPKTPSSRRTVPVPDAVLEALAEHIAAYPAGPFDVVFTNTRGAHVNRTSFHRSWVLALTKAKAPAGTHFHDLRHGYVSTLIEGGESVVVVARRVGHSNANETLSTYSHLMADSSEKTRRVIDEAFQTARAEPEVDEKEHETWAP